MAKKSELYVGAYVTCRSIADPDRFNNKWGTIIDLDCTSEHDFDCLVEFDEYVQGHDGLGWGTVIGKKGHCYWFRAGEIDLVDVIREVPEATEITYDSLF